MIKAKCICHKETNLSSYKLILIDNILLYREYYGKCTCGNNVLFEDWNESDQIYLDCPELLKYLK
ncbi:hypothetical protein J2Z34_003426 [Youngiibacter multivorans]|uniref:Uncharacterized protein n=1 Tax=Youngiibacter multivorans TaxID=937251 RepID=A0ABS4G8P6_9CLOT|nr:hypothetical protein [Youngiibacter multivorans]